MSTENTQPTEITWTPEAQARLAKVPIFVRKMVKKKIEKYAVSKGVSEITAELVQEAKDAQM